VCVTAPPTLERAVLLWMGLKPTLLSTVAVERE
jgi:hypothetical protein